MILILFGVVERADLQKGSRRKEKIVFFKGGHSLCVADLIFMFILEVTQNELQGSELQGIVQRRKGKP